MSNKSTANALNFEQALSDIDTVIRTMESNKVPLAESVALFEKGTKLIQQCQETLKTAEQTVTTLMHHESDEQNGS